jgi:hypothetical protein
MKSNIFLANIVYLSHLLLILFIIYGPFTSNPLILLLHIVSCICLLFHWYMNSDLCSLNILEAKLRNIKISQTITYQFIKPVYNISELKWNKFIWLITIIVLLLSLYKFYKFYKLKGKQNIFTYLYLVLQKYYRTNRTIN